MPLDAAAVLTLAAACAPGVAPATVLAIARVESGLDPLAIGVNARRPIAPRPSDLSDAVRIAEALVARGVDVDLGLAQINVRNLRGLEMTVAEAFDPCANLNAAARVLTDGFRRTSAASSVQTRLRVALSFYNTGHPERGFANGYVAKVTAAAGIVSARPTSTRQLAAQVRAAAPAWAVFRAGDPAPANFVVTFKPGVRP